MALRVGPFAAIREAEFEMRRKKNGSLDIEEMATAMEMTESAGSSNGSLMNAGSGRKMSRDNFGANAPPK